MPPTLQDIADRVGLSPQAVSQAMNRNGRLRPETRRRVLSTAHELGYRPNAAARATARGRFGCLALLTGTQATRSQVFSGLLAGIHEGLDEHRLNLMLVRMPDERLTDPRTMPRALAESASDGFLVDYTHGIPPKMVELIRGFDIPAVWINSRQPYDCVRPDDLDAGTAATRRLLGLGHRDIAYASYAHAADDDQTHYSVAERRAGYERAMRGAGLTPRVLAGPSDAGLPTSERVAYSRAWLASSDRPSAVVSYGGGDAQAIYHAAACLGLRVPADLSLVTFSQSPIKWFGPHLSMWLTPDHGVGRDAASMLVEKVRRGGQRLRTRKVRFRFYEHGATCRAVNRS